MGIEAAVVNLKHREIYLKERLKQLEGGDRPFAHQILD